MKRLVVVFHSSEVSGPLRTLEPRLRALRESFDIVTVVTRRGSVSDVASHVGVLWLAPRLRQFAFPGSSGEFIRSAWLLMQQAWQMAAIFRRAQPDAVLCVTATLPQVCLAARLYGCPSIVYAAEIFDRSGPRRRPAASYAHAVQMLATQVVCASRSVATQYQARLRPEPAIVHPGVPAPDPDAPQTDRVAARDSLGVPRDAFCVTTVGRLSPGRGQAVLVDALDAIVTHVPRVHCLIVGSPGDSSYAATLERQAARFEGRVRFIASPAPMNAVYAASDVVVNPAVVPEGFGRVACEALLAGTPVVSTRVGAVEEIFADGLHVLLIPASDAGALANAVVTLAARPQLAADLVDRGRKRVAEIADVERTNEQFVRVVQQAVTERLK